MEPANKSPLNFKRGKKDETEIEFLPDADAIERGEDHVIIAGFGRFGQIVGRFLNANGVKLTVLDHDPDQIDVLRRFGFKVFYGDATRADLLRAAGAARARRPEPILRAPSACRLAHRRRLLQ